jgi:hypothetical protein
MLPGPTDAAREEHPHPDTRWTGRPPARAPSPAGPAPFLSRAASPRGTHHRQAHTASSASSASSSASSPRVPHPGTDQ